MPAKIAMIAMTTSNSMRVNAARRSGTVVNGEFMAGWTPFQIFLRSFAIGSHRGWLNSNLPPHRVKDFLPDFAHTAFDEDLKSASWAGWAGKK
jgi:hypothetical protein